MMNSIINSALRGIVTYFLLLIVTRFMGRKIISHMTFYDFAVAITLGSLAASLGMGAETNSLTAATVILTLAVLVVLTGFLNIKSLTFRKLVNSEPITLINKGEMVRENMKKARVTVNHLNTLLRTKNIFNIVDVEFAMMENNGELSVLPKSQKQPLTPSDLNMVTPFKGLTRELIIDGQVLKENLQGANLDQSWLLARLKEQGINNVKEVFFAALDSSGNLYVSQGNKRKEREGEYGIE